MQKRALKRTLSGTALLAFSLMQLGKRIGLGKPMLRFAFRFMFSERLKRDAFAGYVPSEHDVFVTTYAKSGTNWMMQIAQQIACYGEAEFDHIHDLVPWPDTPGPGPVGLADPRAQPQSPTGLRVIKTHLETGFVPYAEKARYLTVIRDPKEVVVSSYYFLGGILGVLSHVTIDQWLDLCMEPGALMSTWAVHTAGFWEWRERPNVLVLSYAELNKESRRCVERVAGVMGVRLTEPQLQRVIERASFGYMKAHEPQFSPPRPPFSKPENATKMIRSGKAGDSGELLSLSQQAAVDRLCQGELRRLGSDFPYAELFLVMEST